MALFSFATWFKVGSFHASFSEASATSLKLPGACDERWRAKAASMDGVPFSQCLLFA